MGSELYCRWGVEWSTESCHAKIICRLVGDLVIVQPERVGEASGDEFRLTFFAVGWQTVTIQEMKDGRLQRRSG